MCVAGCLFGSNKHRLELQERVELIIQPARYKWRPMWGLWSKPWKSSQTSLPSLSAREL